MLSIAKSGLNPQMTEEEIRAVVTTARGYGFKVAAHAHGTEGIKRAVRGGVDTIEHGTFMDDEGMKLMKEHGTFYVPTISAGRWVFDQAQDPTFFPAVVRPKALQVGPQIQSTFAKAYKSAPQSYVDGLHDALWVGAVLALAAAAASALLIRDRRTDAVDVPREVAVETA